MRKRKLKGYNTKGSLPHVKVGVAMVMGGKGLGEACGDSAVALAATPGNRLRRETVRTRCVAYPPCWFMKAKHSLPLPPPAHSSPDPWATGLWRRWRPTARGCAR